MELIINVENKTDETKNRSFKGEKHIANNINDATNLFGEEIVFDFFLAHAKSVLSGIIRRMIQAGDNDEKITEFVASWKPGNVLERRSGTRDPLASIKKRASSMTDEEKLELAKALGLM